MTQHEQRVEALRRASALLLALNIYLKEPPIEWSQGAKLCKAISDLCMVSLPNKHRFLRMQIDDIYEHGIKAKALKDIFKLNKI